MAETNEANRVDQRLPDPDDTAQVHLCAVWATTDQEGQVLYAVQYTAAREALPTVCTNPRCLSKLIARAESAELTEDVAGWPACPVPGCGWSYRPEQEAGVVYVRGSVLERRADLRRAIWGAVTWYAERAAAAPPPVTRAGIGYLALR